ncbi:cation channel sperm-associated protein 3-like [Styela clava]|uniref:cation channel sperm-associated protein 3-like n=1 Tax=Styela clava TaxID=7725 RepID=UPI00193A954D|nr:cation channel sperm-associated protein 3-like [Styela clava]
MSTTKPDHRRRGAVISQDNEDKDIYDDLEDDENDELKEEPGCDEWRKDKVVHDFASEVSESSIFNGAIMLTILINSVIMMLEVNDSYESLRPLYPAFDITFLTIYSVEFAIKIYAEPVNYWKSLSNRFDFFVLLISYFQVLMDEIQIETAGDTASWAGALPVLRTLKATRAIRAMRAVSFVRGLQVLLTALIDTMKKSFINVMLILLFLMFLFAIFGYYMFGYKGGDEANWGDLGSAFLTLFSFVTVDGWFDAQLQMDEKTTEYSRIYTILFIVVGHFLIFNIFVGVNIMNIQEANESYHEQVIAEKEAILARKKEAILHRQHEDVRKLKEKQIEKDCGNFYDMVKSFQETLRSDDYTIMEDTVSDPSWLELYLETLDHMDITAYRLQNLHYEMAHILSQLMSREISKRLGE